jgi:hypothetical protein
MVARSAGRIPFFSRRGRWWGPTHIVRLTFRPPPPPLPPSSLLFFGERAVP